MKEFLSKSGIAYIERDIENHPGALDELNSLGVQSLPVTVISGKLVLGFNPKQLDPSLVYRVLRELEMVDFVTSEWDSNSLGPQRRVYKITPEGENHLDEWMKDLRRTRKEIEALEAAYEAVQGNKKNVNHD